MRLALLFMLVSILPARERINGLYFGEDVSFSDSKGVAVEFFDDGTVLVHLGAVVPGLKDAHGVPVRIRKVRTIHE